MYKFSYIKTFAFETINLLVNVTVIFIGIDHGFPALLGRASNV